MRRDPESRACEALPKTIGEAQSGLPCPNNPFEREKKLFFEYQKVHAFLELAHYLEDLSQLGILDYPKLSPEEMTATRILHWRNRVRQMPPEQAEEENT